MLFDRVKSLDAIPGDSREQSARLHRSLGVFQLTLPGIAQ